MAVQPALLVVDVQNDFCPGGALAVPQGDEVVGVMNTYIAFFRSRHWPVLASRDWHPRETSHFKEFGGPWPVHCVQNTPGAAFHSKLNLPEEAVIISKGMAPQGESYSAFLGRDDDGISLKHKLKELDVTDLFVGGLATDYCVKSSCLDAMRHGLRTYVLMDAVRGVDLAPGDSQKALEEMFSAGVKSLNLDEFKKMGQEA